MSKWLSDAPLSEWDGVKTDDDGRVIELDLNYNYLSGEIPAELGSLSNLTELSLRGNYLSGEIPAQLGSLSNLTELDLHDNNLSGVFPEDFTDYLTEKDQEAIASPARFKSQAAKGKSAKNLALADYQEKMAEIFTECRRVIKDDGIMTVMFNHKSTAAWDALTVALIKAEFAIRSCPARRELMVSSSARCSRAMSPDCSWIILITVWRFLPVSMFSTILVTTSLSRYSASIGRVVQSSAPRSMRVGQTYRLSGSWVVVISVPQGSHLTSPARRWR